MNNHSGHFVNAIDQFLGTIDALREIVDSTVTSPTPPNSLLRASIDTALQHIPTQKQEILHDALGSLAVALGNTALELAPQGPNAEHIAKRLKEAIPQQKTGKVNIHQKTTTTPDGKERTYYNIDINDKDVSEAVSDLITSAARAIKRPPRHQLILSSLVVSAVSAFEVLISQLATAYFRIHPAAIDGNEKEFSLNDLKELKSIQDAIEISIQRQVDSIGRGLTDWHSWFHKRLKIDFTTSCIDWEAIQEIFQRRHIAVHNDGKISQQYINKTPLTGKSAKIGDRLLIEENYAKEALIQLAAFGASLGILTWWKLCPDQGPLIASRQIELGQHFAESSDWRSVLAISQMPPKATIPTALKHEIDCNSWLASKHSAGDTVFQTAVENWDVSALQPRYRLYRLCLLDRIDDAISMLPEMLATNSITVNRLRRLPIFSNLRIHPSFEGVIGGQDSGRTHSTDE